VRAAAVLAGLVVFTLAGAGAASADAPVTWDEGQSRSTLDTLIFFGGGTLALIVFLTLFSLVTMRRHYVPPTPPPSTDLEVAPDSSPAHH